MPSSSRSRLPISESAAPIDRAKSFIRLPSPEFYRRDALSLPAVLVRMSMRGMRMPMPALDRHHHDMAVAHAALGDDLIGERFHLATASLQHGHLEARIVVDV